MRSEAIVDKAYRVTDAEAVQMSRWLLREEGSQPVRPMHMRCSPYVTAAGIFVGSSSSINVVGAIRTARRLGPGHTIVTVLCDSGQVRALLPARPVLDADRPLHSVTLLGFGTRSTCRPWALVGSPTRWL